VPGELDDGVADEQGGDEGQQERERHRGAGRGRSRGGVEHDRDDRRHGGGGKRNAVRDAQHVALESLLAGGRGFAARGAAD